MLAPVALANDALEDAFSAPKVLRPLQSGTCDAPTPEWLRGEWTARVALRRRELPAVGLVLPAWWFYAARAGARRGTDPSHTERRRRAEGLCTVLRTPRSATSADATNAAAALPNALWSRHCDIAVEQQRETHDRAL